MPLETGGRADKAGNRYEIKCIIYELLKVIREKNYSVVIEALGDDEEGTDILVTSSDGVKEHQQCKVRNASKECWSISDLNSRGILKNWKRQLERGENRQVALVSPIGCSYIVDLHDRAINTNGNPRDFYVHQIRQNGEKFCESYEKFCMGMGINCTEDAAIAKSIDYLQRINFKQFSEFALRENISQGIEFCFCSDKEAVFNAFVSLIIDGDIWGKEITLPFLIDYFEKYNILFRLWDRDIRIAPQVSSVNKEYRNSFKPLKEGFIERVEFERCIDAIKKEQSFIISGNAGSGKSGCTEAILNYCEKENIPYIAIKLDRRIPHGNCELWGQDLGFPGSISYALNAISKDRPAVIVLDQLDALRWTQANSSEALSVCMELIKQVRYINYGRKKNISVVFVCREYDLNNDSNIRSLFKEESDSNHKEEWQKIIVNNFDEDTVKRVVGEQYDQLTLKTRRLLQIPSNLYIWQQLDKNELHNECTTTSNLIEAWFRQICKKSNNVGVDEKDVRDTLEYVVDLLDKVGRLYVPKKLLKVEERGFDYLVSVEILIQDGNRVGFVHQSILDYFISKRMMQQYYDGKEIEVIVGEKNKQTPGKRYQIQMFLQNLLEYDSADFLSAGNQMIESSLVRFYVKYVFYEIMRQISEPDARIAEYIINGCKDENKQEYLLNNVILGRHPYIVILREHGILEKWFSDNNKKHIVFALFYSVSPNLDAQDIAFIKNRSFVNEDDDKQFERCFFHNVMQDSDELFELRMMFYNKYPSWAQEVYIDVKAMFLHFESRAIRLISFWLKNKTLSQGKTVYKYEEELIDENDAFVIHNGKYILDELLPYIPRKEIQIIRFSEWSNIYSYQRGLERVAVELIKKANKAIISNCPELFWEYYTPYMGKNYAVFNEIILHGLKFLPTSFSDRVISYLSSDLDKNVFDCTSGEEDQLKSVREVIKIHTVFCSLECLSNFLDTIEKYISDRAVEWYKSRIERNKQKKYAPIYWSFWGDLQYQLLQCVPNERLPPKYQDLLKVLERRFQGKTNHYTNGDGHSGWVKSPISRKKIGKKQWIQIITNRKLPNRKNVNWKEVDGGFVESSLEMFARDFQEAVKNEPTEMIKMVIEHKKEVVDVFVDAMFAGVEYSEVIDYVELPLLEKMFRIFPCDMESYRASYFCGIIAKTKIYSWSTDVIDLLKEIAVNHKGDDLNRRTKDSAELESEELLSWGYDCARGNALRAMGQLLWNNKELFGDFKEIVDASTVDEDAVIRMASLQALWPIYNIDREWAEKRLLQVYESDVRMAGFPDSKNMFFRLYPKYKERILGLIQKCFKADDKRLMQIGGYAVCEFFIQYNEFEEIMSHVEQLDEEQIKAILLMAVLYLKSDEHREKSKSIILTYKNSDSDVEISLGKMFYDGLVDLERDSDFLIDIMKSSVSKRMVYSFVHFLEKNARSVKDFADVIITLCENVLSMSREDIASQWGIGDSISKLIIALYDETANSISESDRQIAEKCLELWDVMFEKQIGQVRELSRELMER